MLDKKSSLILCTNSRLTGNVKIVVDSLDKLYLELIPANSTLKSTTISNPIIDKNGEFVNDICNKYKSIPDNLFYDIEKNDVTTQKTSILEQFNTLYSYGLDNCISKLHNEQFKLFAPLLIGEKVPKYFVIFKVDELDDEKTNQTELIIGNQYIVQTLTSDDYITHNNKKYTHSNIFIAETTTYTSNKNINVKVVNYSDSPNDINQDLFNSYIKKSNIVKIFDLQNSSIGTYLSKLTSNKKFTDAPIKVDFNAKVIYYTGISKNKGEIITVEENIESIFKKEMEISKFDRYVTDGFMRNGICMSNLINFEFLFDDDTSEDFQFNRYFGLYLDEFSEDDVDLSILSDVEGLFYTKDVYADIFHLVDFDTKQPKTELDTSKALIEKLQTKRTKTNGISSINLEITDKVYIGHEIQIFKNGNILGSIVSDELPQLTSTDFVYDKWKNEGTVFNMYNPIGSIAEIAKRMCTAINYEIGNYGFGDMKYMWSGSNIMFYMTYMPDITLEFKVSECFKSESISIPISSFTGNAKTKNHRFIIDKANRKLFDSSAYVQTMSGNLAGIKNFSSYFDVDVIELSESNELINYNELNKYLSVTIDDKSDEVLFTQKNKVLIYKDRIFKDGVFDITPIKSFFIDFEQAYVNPHLHEYNKYYNLIDNQLIVGEAYLLFSSNKLITTIHHNGVQYSTSVITPETPTEFIATATSFNILKGIPVIINKKYYNDQEISNFSGFYGLNEDSSSFSYQLNIYQNLTHQPYLVRTLTLTEDNTEEPLNQYVSYNVVVNKEDEPLSYDNYYVKFAQNFVQTIIVQQDKIKYLLSYDFINEYKRMKEDINGVYEDSKLLPFIINKWSMKDKDARCDNYRLNISPSFGETNQCSSIDRFAVNQQYYTNEWFYISSYPDLILSENIKSNKFYFDKLFDSNSHKSDGVDYFTRYFTVYSANIDNAKYSVNYQKRWATFEKTFDNQYDIFFNGIKYRIISNNIDYTDYKFAVILNVKKEVSNGIMEVDISTNHKYKSICLCINVEINDYKIIDKDGNLRPDYVYMYAMRSLVSVVGDNVLDVSTTKVYGQQTNLSNLPYDLFSRTTAIDSETQLPIDVQINNTYGYKMKSIFDFDLESLSLRLKADPLYLRNILQSIQDLSILIDENQEYIAPLAKSILDNSTEIHINNLESVVTKISDYKYVLSQHIESYKSGVTTPISDIDNNLLSELAYIFIVGGGQNIYLKLQQLLTASSFFRLIQENKSYINNSIIDDGNKFLMIQHTKLHLDKTYNTKTENFDDTRFDFVRMSGRYYPETFDVINFKSIIKSEMIKESELFLDSQITFIPTDYSNEVDKLRNSELVLETNLEIEKYNPFIFYGYNVKLNQKYELDESIGRYKLDVFKNMFEKYYTVFENVGASKLVNISQSKEFEFLKTFFNSTNLKLPFQISSSQFQSVTTQESLIVNSSLYYLKTQDNKLNIRIDYINLLKDIVYYKIKDQIFKYSIINVDIDVFIKLIVERIYKFYVINLVKIYEREDGLGKFEFEDISESYLTRINYKQIKNYILNTYIENGYSEIEVNNYTDQSICVRYDLTLL